MIWEEMGYNKYNKLLESFFSKLETEPEWFFEYKTQEEEKYNGIDETDFFIFD